MRHGTFTSVVSRRSGFPAFTVRAEIVLSQAGVKSEFPPAAREGSVSFDPAGKKNPVLTTESKAKEPYPRAYIPPSPSARVISTMPVAATNKAARDDTTFNKVNRFISLEQEYVKRTNLLLDGVLDSLIEILKNTDPLFKDIFQKRIYAGSFYKGTKVGKPDEFDLDLVLKLPVDYNKIEFEEDRPGYTRIKLPSDCFKAARETHKRELNKWISNTHNCLSNKALREWFESILMKSLLKMETMDRRWYILKIRAGQTVKVMTRKSGPAITLLVEYSGGKFDVDLVPVFEFQTRPKLTVFERIPIINKSWYLVPKPLKADNSSPELSWRFCFYDYEKALLSYNGKIKPVIRHLKKLKDCQNWSSTLASYYIETLVYHELHNSSLDLIASPMNALLIHMLTKLYEACDKHSLPYYWDSRHNLIGEKTPSQLLPIKQRMKTIIKNITETPEKAIEYFLDKNERQVLDDARSSSPTTPNTENAENGQSWLGIFNFEVFSPVLEPLLHMEEQLLIGFPEPKVSKVPKNIHSKDQISILTQTVAALTDEIKSLKSTYTGEIRELKNCIHALKEQTETMNGIIQFLVRKKIGGLNLMNQSLL